MAVVASNLQSALDDEEESEDDTDAEATVIREAGVGGSTKRMSRCLSITSQTAQAERDEVTENKNTRRRRHCRQEKGMVLFGVVV